MSCSCIKNNNYDFSLSYPSCYSLIYSDLSEWMTGEHYVIPDIYTIEITPPEYSTKSISVKTFGATKITSNDLFGAEGLCISDGIYCFKIDNCQDILTKYKAITCKLECRKDNLVLKANSSEDWENVRKVESLIYSIHANANNGNYREANSEYKFAKKILDNLNCDC